MLTMAWQSAISVSSALSIVITLKWRHREPTGAASGPYEKLMLVFQNLLHSLSPMSKYKDEH